MHSHPCCLVGMKHAGKTTLMQALCAKYAYAACDIDDLLLKQYADTTVTSVRMLYQRVSLSEFHTRETEALKEALRMHPPLIIATGGGIIDNSEAVQLLKTMSVVYLSISADTAWHRIEQGGIPAFLDTQNPRQDFLHLYARRSKAYANISDLTLNAEQDIPDLMQDFLDHVEPNTENISLP